MHFHGRGERRKLWAAASGSRVMHLMGASCPAVPDASHHMSTSTETLKARIRKQQREENGEGKEDAIENHEAKGKAPEGVETQELYIMQVSCFCRILVTFACV